MSAIHNCAAVMNETKTKPLKISSYNEWERGSVTELRFLVNSLHYILLCLTHCIIFSCNEFERGKG